MASEPTPFTPSGDALDRVNEAFHDAYDQARAGAAEAAPVLILLADELTLIEGDSRKSVSTAAKDFLLIRSAAHAPLSAYSLLKRGDGKDPKPSLAALSKRLDEALKTLGEGLEDAREVVRRTRAFIEAPRDLTGFAREMGPLLLRLAEHGTRVQLSALHAATEKLAKSVLADPRLQVVVAGAHQARDRNLAVQYFRKRLNEPEGSEERVTYAENLAKIEDVLTLIATRRFDRDLAADFFGNPKRLQRDVLGDAAAKLLKEGWEGRGEM